MNSVAPSVVKDELNFKVEARLLTSFEAPSEEGGTRHRRLEIIHELLLAVWPRLARWRDQDAEGARLRDRSGRLRICGTSEGARSSSCGAGHRSRSTWSGKSAIPAGSLPASYAGNRARRKPRGVPPLRRAGGIRPRPADGGTNTVFTKARSSAEKVARATK